MEEYQTCTDLGYKFISDLVSFSNRKKTVEEIFHFVNIELEYRFGVTATVFIYKRYNGGSKIEISRGFSHEFVKKFNDNPPESIVEKLKNAEKKSTYVNFIEEQEKYKDYESLLVHENVKEFYAYELSTAYTDSYFVILYSVGGFKNCSNNKGDVFDTIFSVLAYILNSNKCIQTMKECSQIDYVSGLHNFKYFHEKLFQEMQKVKADGGMFSVALISLNQLNKLNSTFGHNEGDKYIALIANVMKKYIRIYDTAARYGNKFIILFPNAEKDEIRKNLEDVFKEIEEAFKKDNQDILSLNAGVSSFPSDGNNERTILDVAEARRMDARRTGKWSII